MAIIYYPKGAQLGYRDSFNPLYEQLTIATNPNTVFYFDSASSAQGVSASGLFITCSWAQTASVTILFSSNSLSSAYAETASCVNAGYYKATSNFTNIRTGSYIISDVDDGKLVVINSGSSVYVTITSSVSTAFSSMFYQSGSGAILFTGSGITLRNRNSQTASSGQYALVSLIRVPNGDFVLGGDTA